MKHPADEVSSIDESSLRNLFKGSSIAISGRLFGRLFVYITQIILARILSPNGFGLFAIGWTILRIFSIFGHLGLDSGVLYFGANLYKKDSLKLRNIFFLSIAGAFLSGSITGLILFFSAPWLSISVFKKPDLISILQGFAVIFPFVTTLRVLAATSSISKKLLCGGLAEDLSQPVTQMALFFILIQFSDELDAAIISTNLSYIIAVVFCSICVFRLLPDLFQKGKFYLHYIKRLTIFSIPTIIGVTLGSFSIWGDRLVVGLFGSQTDAGIYQSISSLTMFTTLLLSGLKIVSAPEISQLYKMNNFIKINNLSKTLTRWIFYLSLPTLIILIIIPEDLILLLYGDEYLLGITPLRILTFSQLFYLSFGISDNLFILTGNQKYWLYISLFMFLALILFDYFLIPCYGILGAAMVTSIFMLTKAIIVLITLRRKMGLWLFDCSQLKTIILALLLGTFVYSLTHRLLFSPLIRVAIISSITVSSYGILLFLFVLNKDEKIILFEIIKKIVLNK